MIADHGELLGESGRWSHGGDLHPVLLQIPFIIYDKQKLFYKNLESATIKDIAPTIAARLGMKVPDCWTGNSLNVSAQNFSMKVNSGINCDIPKGVLSKTDSAYKLELMNNRGEIKERLTSLTDTIIWKKN
jgi:hypothetical protein